jgi:hypothetical protein
VSRIVKVGDMIVVQDGDRCQVVRVIRLSLQKRAMYVTVDYMNVASPEFWLPMTAFLDWAEDPVEPTYTTPEAKP